MRIFALIGAFIAASMGSVYAQQTVPIVAGATDILWKSEDSIGFNEGPVYDGAGGVWFSHGPCAPGPGSSCPELRTSLLRFDIQSGETIVLLEDANTVGLAFDNKGRLIAAELSKRVTRRTRDRLEDVEVLTDNWQGKPFFLPNDLVLDRRGGIYFTDSGGRAGNAVYYLANTGKIEQVSRGIPFNNGITLSPGGETLYVASQPRGEIIAFDVQDDSTLSNQRVFAADFGMAPDGLAVDRFGNIYAAGPEGRVGVNARVSTGEPQTRVLAWNRDGEEILSIEPPEGEVPINLTFVPPDGDMLYVVSLGSLYRVPMQFVNVDE